MNSFRTKHLFQCLKRFDNQSLPLDLFLYHYFRDNSAIGSHDRRALSEIIYSMIRHKDLLDFLSESKSWENRYLTYQRCDFSQPLSPTIAPHTRVSFPKELFDLYVRQYGEEKALEIAYNSNLEAPTTIRVNTLKTSREALLPILQEKYGASATLHSPVGIQFPKRLPFSEMEEFKEGLFEVQDEASQLVSFLVQAKPKEKVLDFCAGAGGKALAFAPFLQNRGQIILHDIRNRALSQARKRMKRAGIFNVVYLETLDSLKEKVDWILLDVPCTGTGTYRRNPDAKNRFSLEMLSRLIEEQREIFKKALPFLSKKGKIVFATCSLLEKENEEQVAYFLNNYPLKMVGEPFVSFPSKDGMDGFFAATLSY